MKIILPYPPSILNPNSRPFWAAKARAVKQYKHACMWIAKSHKERPKIDDNGVLKLSITFCPPNNRRRDLDNAIASAKNLQDALATVWGLDDSRFVATYRMGEVVKNGAVVVEV